MPQPNREGDSLPPDVPEYIAGLCAGMVRLAESDRMDMVAYLLGMAKLEAEAVKREREGGQPPPRPSRR